LTLRKRAVASIVVLALIGLGGYFLMSQSAAQGVRGGDGGDGGGSFGGLDLRTLVPLMVIGGSAFITGFGFRDVIARTLAARHRSRIKSAPSSASVRH